MRTPTKNARLLWTLRTLHLERRGWALVDEWEADLAAIGIASPLHPDRVLYLCNFGKPPGVLYYSFEVSQPETPDRLPWRSIREGEVTETDLAALATAFLDAASLDDLPTPPPAVHRAER